MALKTDENPTCLLQTGLAQLEISLTEKSIGHLLVYAGELRKWNRHINLIARNTGIQEIIASHFLDSLTLLFFVCQTDSHRETLLDVGAGAGFPGLVLAVSRPDLRVILVEPRSKRVSFLRHVVRLLMLENVEVIEDRLEDASELYERAISAVPSRAVADPAVFLPMVAPLVDRGADVLLMLGPTQEKKLSATAFPEKMTLAECRNFVLPFTGARRTVCRLTKDLASALPRDTGGSVR